MPLQNAVPRHSRFSHWLEWMRDPGRRADGYRDETQDPGELFRKRVNDDDRESWIGGYSAFWQDLAATWLVAVLIAGIIFAVQSSKDPQPSIASVAATATTTTQAPPGKAIHKPARGEPGSLECTDLDYAYGWC